MTREEAFKLAMQACKETWNEKTCAEIIKALEQEPCDHPDKCHECNKILTCTYYKQKSSTDCISRQEVLEEINRVGVKGFKTYNDYSQLYDFVDGLSPVTPSEDELTDAYYSGYQEAWQNAKLKYDRPTGHWINGNDKCPCCGKSKFDGLDADIWADWQPPYCPNCGAKMGEPQEREE